MIRSVVQRRLSDPVAVFEPFRAESTTARGDILELSSVDLVQRTILVSGHWEPNVSEVLVRLLEPGDAFVDVGANIGYYTVLAHRLLGPGANIVAIEASPILCSEVRRNLRRNGYPTDGVINCAVGDTEGMVDVVMGPAHNLGLTSIRAVGVGESAGHPDRVSMRSLDSIADPCTGSAATVVKIDIEGNEAAASAGIEAFLHSAGPEAALLIEWTPDGDEVLDQSWLAAMAARLEMCGFLIPNGYSSSERYAGGSRRPVVPIPPRMAERCDLVYVRGDRLIRAVEGASKQRQRRRYGMKTHV